MSVADTKPLPAFIPWGKLEIEGSTLRSMHPLVDHCIDVACVMRELVGLRAIARALPLAAGRELSPVDIERLLCLTFLHDLGKASCVFQVKFWLRQGIQVQGWPSEGGHSYEAWALFDGHEARAQTILAGLPLEEMVTWGEEAVFSLLKASISHHGKPVSGSNGLDPAAWRPIVDSSCPYNPAETAALLGKTAKRLFPLAFDSEHPAASLPLPAGSAFAHLFAGLVQLADWLGSDTRFFPYTQPGEIREVTAAAAARRAMATLGLDPTDLLSSLEQSGPRDFSAIFQVPSPRPMQARMNGANMGRLVILESETGSGKTEAAIWRFYTLFSAGLVDGMYFATPTRVAATELCTRVERVINRIWPDGAPPVVRALPGYEAADGHLAKRLPGFEVLWSDNPSDAQAERRWAAESPKRFLAATVAVGTVDQALLGGLQVKHAHLRHAMLARHLLVVDEVHASDAYMSALLRHLLKWHLAAGGHALLLSATLGSVARSGYLALTAGQSGKVQAPDLVDAIHDPYPAISYVAEGPNGVPAGARMEGADAYGYEKVITCELLEAIDDPASIAARAMEAAEQGARVLIIRNTVPSAVAVFRLIEAAARGSTRFSLFQVKGVHTLHHSRFSKQDRPLLDAEVQRQMGKVRSKVEAGERIGGSPGLILVGTQTLEQSLDIDSDLLITDLCPADVLLQRMGRLHRHKRPAPDTPWDLRPPGFEAPRAVVLVPSGGELTPLLSRARHGLGPMRRAGAIDGVYQDVRQLEAIRRILAEFKTLKIPTQNREVVERCTHPQALAAVAASKGAAWEKFGSELDGAYSAKATVANLHALPFDLAFDELTFPGSDAKVATRLGEADRLITFAQPVAGPFGPVTALTLRHFMVPAGTPFDAEPTVLRQEVSVAGEGGPAFEFDLGGFAFRYSHTGIERLG